MTTKLEPKDVGIKDVQTGHALEEVKWLKRADALRKSGNTALAKVEQWVYQVGDWWNEGDQYGKRRQEGAERIGLTYKTCADYGAAARVLPPGNSGRLEIEASKAAALVKVPEPEREHFVDMAKEKSRSEMRKLVNAKFGKPSKPKAAPTDAAKPAHNEPADVVEGDWRETEHEGTALKSTAKDGVSIRVSAEAFEGIRQHKIGEFVNRDNPDEREVWKTEAE
jgi:hypothetical protein